MSDPHPVTFTRADIVDLLEQDLDPDFVAKVRDVKAKREQDKDEQGPPQTPNRSG